MEQLKIDFEEWRPIKGYEGLYEVSSLGNVISLDHIDHCGRFKKGKLLKQSPSGFKSRYFGVCLYKDGVPNFKLSHIIAAQAFPEICGEWFEGCDVHHKDGNHRNNDINNLIVISKEEHKKIHQKDLNNACIKAFGNIIEQYTIDGEFIAEYPSAREAERQTGIPHSSIMLCCNGKTIKDSKGHSYTRKTAGNYIWKLKEVA